MIAMDGRIHPEIKYHGVQMMVTVVWRDTMLDTASFGGTVAGTVISIGDPVSGTVSYDAAAPSLGPPFPGAEDYDNSSGLLSLTVGGTTFTGNLVPKITVDNNGAPDDIMSFSDTDTTQSNPTFMLVSLAGAAL